MAEREPVSPAQSADGGGGEPKRASRLMPAAVPGKATGAPKLAWHVAEPEEIAKYWWTGLDGLDEDEARGRVGRLGANRLAEAPPPSLLRKFFAQVMDFTVLALLAAAAIAGVLGWLYPEAGASFIERFGDSLAILMIVVLNAVLGLVQEARAERALGALRDMTAPTARVVRSGRTVDVPAAELVPGDVMLLEEGDRIAADARLIEAWELSVDEAPLTGESGAVQKDAHATLEADTPLAERTTMVYMGTRVARGRARAIIANTSMYTQLGAIAGMLARVAPEPTPLEKELDRFGKRVVLGCVAISGLVFLAGRLVGHESIRELFLVAVALAVAAIPEGLPAVTTIVLAIGTQRMAQRHALVRRLPAVETLGSAQVICTDKTGTLTQNRMTVRRLWVGGVTCDVTGDARRGEAVIAPAQIDGSDGKPPHADDLARVLAAAAHATGAKVSPPSETVVAAEAAGEPIEILGDPTDAALVALAWSGGARERAAVVLEQPFTSQRRMASVVVSVPSATGLASIDGARRSWVRGAPEAVLERATGIQRGGVVVPLDEATRADVTATAAAWAGRALRVIALAYRELPSGNEGRGLAGESELVLLALVGINDPPRPEVKAAIAEARAAGVRTMMITGDHPATGRAVAEEIGLWESGDLIVTGAELDEWDQQRVEHVVDRVRVVARATAEHKLRIVEALKARGFVCAMTGDGINDAPAVKAASIGIAMGRTGTDVTKEAAALVLADDNYATIVAAVEEGRAIYENIRKFIFFLLSSNAGAVLLVLSASLLGWDAPLMPIQILWINLITNGLPALALGVDGRDPDQMKRPPRASGGSVLTAREYVDMVVVGAVMALTAGWAFHHLRFGHHDALNLLRARTTCFAILALGPLVHAFNCRSTTRTLFTRDRTGWFGNGALWGSVLVGIALTAFAIYVPVMRPVFRTGDPGVEGLAWIGAMSLAPLVFVELAKIGRRWRAKRP